MTQTNEKKPLIEKKTCLMSIIEIKKKQVKKVVTLSGIGRCHVAHSRRNKPNSLSDA